MRSAIRYLPARQRGAALLGLLALVSAAVIFAYVAGLSRSAAGMAQARSQRTSIAMAQAKEALIAYAVTYKDTHDTDTSFNVPGYLPCPDMGPASNLEGTAASNCTNAADFLVSKMGRLPWKTLGLDALKDGAGECLWYAVSGTYKNNPNGVGSTNANMMNWDSNGLFKVLDSNNNTLAGASADTQAVAVIFAPGDPISGQDRTPAAGTSNCGGNYNADAYLDSAVVGGVSVDNSAISATAGAVSTYVAGSASSSFNDQLVYITRAEIWNAIKKRTDFSNKLRELTRRAAQCTAMYGTKNGAGANDKRLPWASAVNMAQLSYYAVNRRYRDVSGTDAGRLSVRVSVSDPATNNALVTNTDLGYSGMLLLTPESVTNGSYCAYTAEEKMWYDHWKDHLFYAVAARFNPSASSAAPTCTSAVCLKINGGSTYYAAFVIFAGEKLSSQSRNTLSDKSLIGNYLEGSNTTTNASGNANYQGASASSTFNDIVYAIGANLAVSCYDAASGTMQAAPSSACP